MYGSFRRVAAVTMAALVLFVVLGVSATSGASATPTPAAGSHTSEWAYGVSKNYTFGPVRWIGHPGWVRQGDLIIGFSVILNQTPSTGDPSTFQVAVVRTMGVLFSVQYCTPSCANPSEYLDTHYHQWEYASSQTNLTDQGTVVEDTGSVPALAVLNSSTDFHANLTNTYQWVLPGMGAQSDQLVHHSASVYADVNSTSQVAFSPAFGLFPQNLSASQSWTSESAFNATGVTGAAYFGQERSSAGSTFTLGPGTLQRDVASTGIVSLSGSYTQGHLRSWGGLSYPVIHLSIFGPFSVREGFLLIPNPADLFAPSSEPWSGNQSGSAVASMATLDARASANGHLGIAASSWQFTSTSSDSMNALQAGGLVPAMSPSDAVGDASYTLQAQPESFLAASQQSNCVTTGIGCPSSAASPPLRKLFAELVIGGVVAAVLATLLVVLVAERRRLPPAPYPNAHLYPPGGGTAAGAARPPAQRPATPPTSPPEEDPLDHLW